MLKKVRFFLGICLLGRIALGYSEEVIVAPLKVEGCQEEKEWSKEFSSEHTAHHKDLEISCHYHKGKMVKVHLEKTISANTDVWPLIGHTFTILLGDDPVVSISKAQSTLWLDESHTIFISQDKPVLLRLMAHSISKNFKNEESYLDLKFIPT